MVNARTIHPSPKVTTASITVNANSAEDAVRAVVETLARNGRQAHGEPTATLLGDARPFSYVSINFTGSTKCWSVRVEYTKEQA